MKKLLLILCSLLLTGCYNYNELEDLGIASSVLIDYTDKYEISVEVIENEKGKIYKGSGVSIANAFENVILGTKQKIIYNHLNALIITENVDIESVTAYFLRNPEINNTFYVVLAEDNKIYDSKEDNLGEMIFEILDRNSFHTFFDFSQTLYNDNIDINIPIIDKSYFIDKLKIYNGTTPATVLTQKYIETYKILNNVNDAYIKVNCDDEYFVIRVNQIKSDTKVKDKISISTDIEATIAEFNCKLDLTKEEDVYTLEKYANKKIETDIYDFLNTIKTYNSDILGLNRLINNKYHNLDKTWVDFEYEIDAKTHINKKGLVLK